MSRTPTPNKKVFVVYDLFMVLVKMHLLDNLSDQYYLAVHKCHDGFLRIIPLKHFRTRMSRMRSRLST